MENRTPRFVGVLIAALVVVLLGLGWPSRPQAVQSLSGVLGSGDSQSRSAVEASPVPVSEVENGLWTPTELGVSLAVPSGWTHARYDVRSYLMLDVTDPRAGNVSAIRLPNFFGKDLEGLREENRLALQSNDYLTLDGIQDVDLAGHPALAIDYHGHTVTNEEPLRFRALVLVLGDWQVVLTATARAAAWPELHALFEECLGSLAIVAG